MYIYIYKCEIFTNSAHNVSRADERTLNTFRSSNLLPCAGDKKNTARIRGKGASVFQIEKKTSATSTLNIKPYLNMIP